MWKGRTGSQLLVANQKRALSRDLCFFLQDDPTRLDFSLPNTAFLTLLYQIIKTIQDKAFQTILPEITRISVQCHKWVLKLGATPNCYKVDVDSGWMSKPRGRFPGLDIYIMSILRKSNSLINKIINYI